MNKPPYAVYNPHNKPEEELPAIIGFNNGGSPGFMHAVLLAEDGTFLGAHCCSDECFMPGDLGILEDSRPDRHEEFKKHYPDGYRMDFVSIADIPSNALLNQAIERNKSKGPAGGQS